MVQGTRSDPAHDASGELDEPTLLFFEKGAAFDYDAWDIIGMGYFFELDVDDEGPPTDFPAIDASKSTTACASTRPRARRSSTTT